jgi:hypothetical protein
MSWERDEVRSKSSWAMSKLPEGQEILGFSATY